MEEIVGNGLGEWRAEHRDRRREHELRPIVALRADCLQQIARAIEVDAIALVKIELRLA